MATQSTTYDYINDSHRSYKCSLEGWRDDRRHARLFFGQVVEGTPVNSPGMEPKSISTCTEFEALKKCKDLKINICCGNDPLSICAVQDMFFAFVDRIPDVHCLRSLTVSITVVLPNDVNERSWIVSDIWRSAFLSMPTIYENKTIQPGDLSRMHMIAFLTDPLRKIRGLGREGKIKHVSLEFPGRTGVVWEEILVVVKDLICENSEAKDYEVFRRYFDGARHLIKSMQNAIKTFDEVLDKAMPDGHGPNSPESLTSTLMPARAQDVIDHMIEEQEVVDLTTDASQGPMGLPELREFTKALAMARIRGSFNDLRVGHRSLLTMADNIALAASRLPGDERLASLLERLQQNRDHAVWFFPKKVDVSYYGYNEPDTKLAEYRSDPEGYVLRRVKLKPKRKRKREQDA